MNSSKPATDVPASPPSSSPSFSLDKSRQYISALSILAVALFIGLPVWWKTTEVYRCPLPYKEINDLSYHQVKKLCMQLTMVSHEQLKCFRYCTKKIEFLKVECSYSRSKTGHEIYPLQPVHWPTITQSQYSLLKIITKLGNIWWLQLMTNSTVLWHRHLLCGYKSGTIRDYLQDCCLLSK